ncbi:MAG: hypothetical protein IJ587_10685 [Synergistaceae bacterium]|nr:hypothetical protein [Synergistaceae bacterium]
MCVSTPTIAQPKVEAPTQAVTMDAAESTQAARENDRQRRLRAFSRLRTMDGGAMQGTEAGTGKTRLGT